MFHNFNALISHLTLTLTPTIASHKRHTLLLPLFLMSLLLLFLLFLRFLEETR